MLSSIKYGAIGLGTFLVAAGSGFIGTHGELREIRELGHVSFVEPYYYSARTDSTIQDLDSESRILEGIKVSLNLASGRKEVYFLPESKGDVGDFSDISVGNLAVGLYNEFISRAFIDYNLDGNYDSYFSEIRNRFPKEVYFIEDVSSD